LPNVIIPPPYRGPTAGASEIEVEPGTVRECLDQVIARHPGLGELMFTPEGSPQRFVTLFLNGDQVQNQGLDKPVASGDELEVVAAIAGG